jgi:hypothetical protein
LDYVVEYLSHAVSVDVQKQIVSRQARDNIHATLVGRVAEGVDALFD